MNHLRSDSGSNGLAAKDSSPLLGNRPILIFESKACRGLTQMNADHLDESLNQILGGAGVHACHSRILSVTGFSP